MSTSLVNSVMKNTFIKEITVFKNFISGGISSDIRSAIKFYGDARAETQNVIS